MGAGWWPLACSPPEQYSGALQLQFCSDFEVNGRSGKDQPVLVEALTWRLAVGLLRGVLSDATTSFSLTAN